MANKMNKEEMEKRIKDLESVLNRLVNMYIANRGGDGEFICCITPQSANEMTPLERRKSKHWSLFDEARILLGE